MAVLTSQPLAGSLSQLPYGAVHVPTAQVTAFADPALQKYMTVVSGLGNKPGESSALRLESGMVFMRSILNFTAAASKGEPSLNVRSWPVRPMTPRYARC